MFHGHHGAALLISGALGRPIALPILFILSQIQDVIFMYLAYIAGIEEVALQSPRTNKVTPLDLIYFPYSHGLFSSILLTIVAALLFRGTFAKYAAAAAVASHWVLDFIMHEPDLDVCFPFTTCPKVGLCLWRYLWPSVIVESSVILIGAVVYMRVIKEGSVRRRVSYWLFPLVLVMLSMTAMIPFAPPPPKLDYTVTVQVYCFYLLAAFLAWGSERPLRNSIIKTD